jgi:hypothetical protein
MYRRAGGGGGGGGGGLGGHPSKIKESGAAVATGDDDEALDSKYKANRRGKILNARNFWIFLALKGVTGLCLYVYMGQGLRQHLLLGPTKKVRQPPISDILLQRQIPGAAHAPRNQKVRKEQAIGAKDLSRPADQNKELVAAKEERTTRASVCYTITKSDGNRNTTLSWRQMAIDLAKLPVKVLLQKLEKDDPFGVRKFEVELIQKELELGRTLTGEELRQLFPCPAKCLFTPELHPERLGAPTLFREQAQQKQQSPLLSGESSSSSPFSWLFFQHLRKAGGTHFCSMAQANLPKFAVPRYYCMPDYYWNHTESCAGCLTRFDNGHMTNEMRRAKHRIAGNEWDNFERRFLDMSSTVVFATSFRKPLDRALSQFRFECVEGRGCHESNVTRWWENRKDLYNVYTTTFADPPRTHNRLLTTYLDGADSNHAAKRGELMAQAIDAVLQLHLVLSMEWLAYAGDQVTAVLGFRNISGLTQRVRPHISQAQRKDAQETNALGAASITKASWDPQTYLSPEQFQHMSETLALDMVLTDAARRIFLERLVCP